MSFSAIFRRILHFNQSFFKLSTIPKRTALTTLASYYFLKTVSADDSPPDQFSAKELINREFQHIASLCNHSTSVSLSLLSQLVASLELMHSQYRRFMNLELDSIESILDLIQRGVTLESVDIDAKSWDEMIVGRSEATDLNSSILVMMQMLADVDEALTRLAVAGYASKQGESAAAVVATTLESVKTSLRVIEEKTRFVEQGLAEKRREFVEKLGSGGG